MIFANSKWDLTLNINSEKPLNIIFDNINEMFEFKKNLSIQLEEGEGNFSIIDSEVPLKFKTQVEFISNIMDVSVNTKKSITALYKKLENEIAVSNSIVEFEELREKILIWLDKLREETLIDFSYEKDFEISDFFKIFDIRYTERNNDLFESFIKYINLIVETTKIKVIFISFLGYIFNEDQIKEFFDICKENNIYLILIEKEGHYFENRCEKVKIIDEMVFKLQ